MTLRWTIREPADLRKWNKVCYLLHLGQGIAAIVYTIMFENAREFRIPLETNYAKWNETSGPVHANQKIADVPFAAVACVVPFLSFIAHFLLTYDWPTRVNYEQTIKQFYNTARWIEYAFSSTLMFFLICLLFSIYDLTSLLALACINATTMFCGYLMEQANRLKLSQMQENYRKDKLVLPKLTWLPFIVGAGLGVVQWTLLYSTFSSITQTMPAIVWALVFTYFVLYLSFALNMAYMYYASVQTVFKSDPLLPTKPVQVYYTNTNDSTYYFGWPSRVATLPQDKPMDSSLILKNEPLQVYYTSERIYMVLSLTSKSILLWLIMAGVNQPNPYTP